MFLTDVLNMVVFEICFSCRESFPLSLTRSFDSGIDKNRPFRFVAVIVYCGLVR